jgi:type IV pilus assembly protein PilM
MFEQIKELNPKVRAAGLILKYRRHFNLASKASVIFGMRNIPNLASKASVIFGMRNIPNLASKASVIRRAAGKLIPSPIYREGTKKIKSWFVNALLGSRKVVGLDIGTSSIKVAQLLKTWHEPRVTGFFQREIPREESQKPSPEAISQAIRELFSEVNIEGRVISCLPTSSVITREITMPFKDINKLRRTIKYEAEPHIPFPIDEVAVDFYTINDRLPDKTSLMMVAVNKDVINQHLEVLRDAGIDPEIIDLDSFALFNAFPLGRGGRQAFAVIDLGARTTKVDIVSEGILKFSRSIPLAGDTFTKAIAKEIKVSFAKAEEVKKARPWSDLKAKKISRAVRPVLARLTREIEYTFSSFSAHHPNKEIGQIFLTGGSSRFPGIDDHFSESLNCKISYLDPFKEIQSAIPDKAMSEITPTAAVGIGLALRGLTKPKIAVDFGREMAPAKRFERIKPALRFASILLVTVLLLGVVDFYGRLHLKKRRYMFLKQEIRKVFTQTFPQVKNIVNPVWQMKEKINETQKRLAISPKGHSSLTILRELSLRRPEEFKVYLSDILIDQEAIRISGRTDSFDSVDTFKRELEKSSCFEEVGVSSASLSSDRRLIEFKLTIKVGG